MEIKLYKLPVDSVDNRNFKRILTNKNNNALSG